MTGKEIFSYQNSLGLRVKVVRFLNEHSNSVWLSLNGL